MAEVGAVPVGIQGDGSGFRSGFVALVGRPNVGKSSLVNRIVGSKVAIVSDRPQTTRNQIRGVLTTADAQVVFLDTPGIHKPRTTLGERTNRTSYDALDQVDLVCLLVEGNAPIGTGDEFIAGALSAVAPERRLLVVNKCDGLKPEVVLGCLSAAADKLGDFAAFVPISARTGAGVDTLVSELVRRLEPGPQYYPDGMITDQPEAFLAAEIVREKLLAVTHDEVPHSIVVSVDDIEEHDDGSLGMRVVIRVERQSQKGIVIGKGGAVLKQVGISARQELSGLLGVEVHLDTVVKVEKNWQRRPLVLDRLGL